MLSPRPNRSPITASTYTKPLPLEENKSCCGTVVHELMDRGLLHVEVTWKGEMFTGILLSKSQLKRTDLAEKQEKVMVDATYRDKGLKNKEKTEVVIPSSPDYPDRSCPLFDDRQFWHCEGLGRSETCGKGQQHNLSSNDAVQYGERKTESGDSEIVTASQDAGIRQTTNTPLYLASQAASGCETKNHLPLEIHVIPPTTARSVGTDRDVSIDTIESPASTLGVLSQVPGEKKISILATNQRKTKMSSQQRASTNTELSISSKQNALFSVISSITQRFSTLQNLVSEAFEGTLREQWTDNETVTVAENTGAASFSDSTYLNASSEEIVHKSSRKVPVKENDLSDTLTCNSADRHLYNDMNITASNCLEQAKSQHGTDDVDIVQALLLLKSGKCASFGSPTHSCCSEMPQANRCFQKGTALTKSAQSTPTELPWSVRDLWQRSPRELTPVNMSTGKQNQVTTGHRGVRRTLFQNDTTIENKTQCPNHGAQQ